MSTGYTISIGYNSAHEKAEASEMLKRIVMEIQNKPSLIVSEAKRTNPFVSSNVLLPYAMAYEHPVRDATITVSVDSETGLTSVHQIASGGGDERRYKEIVRRAFCRLVIAEMHSLDMEVNLGVH